MNMGFADKLKDLGDKAKLAAAEHKDQISQTVETAGNVADRRTGGKYRDKIFKATQKAEAAVGKLSGDAEAGQTDPTSSGPAAPSEPAAQSEPGEPPAPSTHT
jgi:hypothetical protein